MDTMIAVEVSEARKVRTKVPETISVASFWGMNNPQSNQTMKRKAQSLLDNVEKVKNKQGLYSEYVRMFEKYFTAYEKACLSPATEEAASEDVSTMVFEFAVRVGKNVGLTRPTLNTLFNKQTHL